MLFDVAALSNGDQSVRGETRPPRADLDPKVMVVVLAVFEEEGEEEEEENEVETASPRSRGGTTGDGVLLLLSSPRDIRRGVSGVRGGGKGRGSTRRYSVTLS